MFSIASPSRVPVPMGQVMVIARSDERADQAAWVSRLRRAHPTGCEGVGRSVELGSYFDPETIATQGRGFLEGVLQELGSKNAHEAESAAVLPAALPAVLPAAAAMMSATSSFATTAGPAASPAGRRISVDDVFAAADKAGGFMGQSGPPPVVAVAVGAILPPTLPPTLPPSANPTASPAGRRISVDDLFAAANKAGGFLGTSSPPPGAVAAAVASFPTPPPPTSPTSAAPPSSRRLSVEDLFAAADKVGGFMGLSGPPPAVAVDSVGLVPALPPVSSFASRWAQAAAAGSAPVATAAAPPVAPVSRWAALWAQAAPAGSAPGVAAAAPGVAAAAPVAPVAAFAAFAALGAAPPTPPVTPPRSQTPPVTTTRPTTRSPTTTTTPPPEANRYRKGSKGKGGKKPKVKKVKKGKK
ncbi:MAG: hypothetical protein M1826_002758 [Phylliscum demangeonii]|nr:MAG: hypothetical protein M1826_002758 [Phylliscum demangeonii]